ncbi:MAG: hypothetical protein R3C71_00010 [Candidatus Krumholzibacteriia bacterium]|nr:hypothetical protein [bacterium]
MTRPSRFGVLVALAIALATGACRRASPPPAPAERPPVELRIHGQGEQHLLAPTDGRVPALAEELRALLDASVPAAGELGRRGLGQALSLGALEFRFTALQRLVSSEGDTLEYWRALVPLGVEPPPPGGGVGVLVLLGSPDYAPVPRLSARPRASLLAILERGPEDVP